MTVNFSLSKESAINGGLKEKTRFKLIIYQVLKRNDLISITILVNATHIELRTAVLTRTCC